VTSIGFGYADPSAAARHLFDISSRLLRRTLAYARCLARRNPNSFRP